MSSIIPILQINMHSYFPETVSSTFKLLKQIPSTTTITAVTQATVDALINYVQELKAYINKLDGIIKYANDQIGLTHSQKNLYNIQNEGQNINFVMRCAGLSVNDSLSWELAADDDAIQALYAEVDDTRLLLEEILYNLNSYQKSANVYADQHPASEYTNFLKAVLDVFDALDTPEPNETVKNYWQSLS